MDRLMTDDVTMANQFCACAPNQEADVEFMADVEAFEMYNRAVGEQLPAFIQKAPIIDEKLELMRTLVTQMPAGYSALLPSALEMELRKSFNLVGVTYSELWYKLVKKTAPIAFINLFADNPYGQDTNAVLETASKRETCVLFIYGQSAIPLLLLEFCREI
jgi:hypothetical protein